MQNTTKAASPSQSTNWLTTYGPLILSLLAILIIAVAWFLNRIDQTAALAAIVIILGGNGIVSATQWQAAPGLISELQQLIGALMGHIQALHQVQLQAMQVQPTVDLLDTTKGAALPIAPTPASTPASQKPIGG